MVKPGATLVVSIPLSLRRVADERYWWPSSDGCYSTKSGYWMGRLGHCGGWASWFGVDNDVLWKAVWGLDGPPKLHHFLWRACTGALATKGRLTERHIIQDKSCLLCGNDDESIIHSLIDCREIACVWRNSPLAGYIENAPRSSFREMFKWLLQRLNNDELRQCSVIMWAGWSFRNSMVHEEPWNCLQQGVQGYIKWVDEYNEYAKLVFHRRLPRSSMGATS
ncbi:hypothetical protein RDABS01_027659 [Bienertia sinuspersici]